MLLGRRQGGGQLTAWQALDFANSDDLKRQQADTQRDALSELI
jgi:hypothetical protein